MSSSVNASLKNSFSASAFSLSVVALPVSMSRSAIPSFRLQFAIDIAENSLRVPFGLFCQGAFILRWFSEQHLVM